MNSVEIVFVCVSWNMKLTHNSFERFTVWLLWHVLIWYCLNKQCCSVLLSLFRIALVTVWLSLILFPLLTMTDIVKLAQYIKVRQRWALIFLELLFIFLVWELDKDHHYMFVSWIEDTIWAFWCITLFALYTMFLNLLAYVGWGMWTLVGVDKYRKDHVKG